MYYYIEIRIYIQKFSVTIFLCLKKTIYLIKYI
mgnify:CR=1 FL=1